TEDQVQSQVALEPLAAVLPLPGKEPGGNRGQGGDRRRDQVVVSGGRQVAVAPPTREKVEGETGHEQGNRKVDQDHVLRVFRQQRGPEVKWVHGDLFAAWGLRSLDDHLGGHLGVDPAVVRIGTGFGERVRKLFIGIYDG